MTPTQQERPRAAQWAENIDTTEGRRVKGLEGATIVNSNPPEELLNVIVNTNDSVWGYNSIDNEIAKLDSSSYTAISASANVSVSAPTPETGDTHGEAVRYPRPTFAPMWAGPHAVTNGQDAHGNFPSSPSVAQASLDAPEGISVAITNKIRHSGDGNADLPSGYSYHFAASWLYDGYQEGPIAPLDSTLMSPGLQAVEMDVLWEYKSPNPRITSLVLYVVEDASGGEEFPEDLPLYFVERVDVDSSRWSASTSASGDTIFGDPDWSGYYGGSGDQDDFSGSVTHTDSDEYSGTSDSNIDDSASISVANMNGLIGDLNRVDVDVDVSTSVQSEASGNSASASVQLKVKDGGTTLETDRVDISGSAGADTLLTANDFTATDADTVVIEVFAAADADNGGSGTVTSNASFTVRDVSVTGTGNPNNVEGFSASYGDSKADNLISGNTYQDRTGIARAVARDSITQYTNSVSAGPYRAVAGAEIDARIGADTTNAAYVLRSKAYRPDMFDWATDFAQVGESVKALAAVGESVVAFCTTNTYIIDRNEWRVIDRLNNVTAFDPSAYVETPRGLIFCDENGVYLWTRSNGYQSLSGSIYENELDAGTSYTSPPQYNGEVTASTFQGLEYSNDREMLVLTYERGSSPGDLYGWGLYLPASKSLEQRPSPFWTHLDLWDNLSVGNVGSLYMQGGTLKMSRTTDIEALFTGSEQPWTWISPPLRPGGYGREVTFYKCDVVGTASTLEYREDENGSFQSAPLSSGGTSGHPKQGTINSGSTPPWKRATRIEVKAEGTGGEHLSALSLTHRPQRAPADT